MRSNRNRGVVYLAVAALWAGTTVLGATQTWDPADDEGATAGSGNWSTVDLKWADGTAGNGISLPWAQGNSAVFGGGGTGPWTVTLQEDITATGVTFSADGYIIASNAAETLTLTGGAAAVTSNLSSTINSNVVISTAAATLTSAAGTLTLGGSLDAGGFALTVTGAGNTNLGAVSNVASMTKSGAGILTLSGANSGTGTTTVTLGTLSLNSASNGGLASGTLAMNHNTILDVAGADRTITNPVNNGSGTSASTNTITGAFSLTIQGKLTGVTNHSTRNLVNNLAGTLTLGDVDITNASTNRGLTISGTGNTTVTGVIANGGTATACTLTLTGTGTKILQGNNTYDGATTISGGLVWMTGDNSGATGNTSVTASGATLRVGAANNIPTGTLTLSNASAVLDLRNDVGTNFGKNVTVTNGKINVDQAVGGSGVNQTHTLGNITHGSASAATSMTITGGNGYGLTVGDVTTVSKTSNNQAWTISNNAPGLFTINSFTGNTGSVNAILVLGGTGDGKITNAVSNGGTGTMGTGMATGGWINVATGVLDLNNMDFTATQTGTTVGTYALQMVANNSVAGSTATLNTGTGTLTLAGHAWNDGAGTSAGGFVNGKLDLGAANLESFGGTTNRQFTIENLSAPYTENYGITVNAVVSGPAGTTLRKANSGQLYLANPANTYDGPTWIWQGALAVNKLADGGQASGIGDSSNAASNLIIGALGGMLRYLGSGDSTDRLFSIGTNGAWIENNGTGPINFTNTGTVGFYSLASVSWTSGSNIVGVGAFQNASHIVDGAPFTSSAPGIPDGTTIVSHDTGANTITLSNATTADATAVPAVTAHNRTVILSGSNTGDNTLSPALADDGLGGKTSLNKAGTGTWIVNGTNTYTGATTISAGILQFGKQVSLYNNTPASWTVGNIAVASGGTLSLNVGGTGEFTAGDIDILKALGDGVGGFLAGSKIGFDTTNATGGSFAYSSTITNTNGGADALGLTKRGTGELALSGANTYTGQTIVAGGKLRLVDPAGTGPSLPIISGGGVDIQKGTLSFDYTGGSSPAATVQPLITASYNGGAWDVGQFRNTTQTSSAGLGWVDNGTTSLNVRYTLYGDATLDGTVNFNDLLKLSQNYNLSGKVWADGDSNYDGFVNFTDLLKLSQNYNQSIGASPEAGPASPVPEPGVLGVLAIGAMGLLARRRR